MKSVKIPEYGKHVVFLGSTGSGKSFMAEKMLEKTKRFFIFDTQDVFSFPKSKIITKPTDAIKAIENRTERIIYKPDRQYQTREINGYIINAIVDSSKKKNPFPRVVYIDEIFHLGYERSFPSALPVAMAISRQRKISWWISTQRPKLIPTNILSEASFIFCFFLSRRMDIEYLSDNIRADKKDFIRTALKMEKENYNFIFLNQNTGDYEIFPKIKNNL